MTPQSFREMAGKMRESAEKYFDHSKYRAGLLDAASAVERLCDEWAARVDDLAEDAFSEQFVLGIIGERGDK